MAYEEVKIRSLTEAEEQYIIEALGVLFSSSPLKSTQHWAAGVMLENDAAFIKGLLLDETKVRRAKDEYRIESSRG